MKKVFLVTLTVLIICFFSSLTWATGNNSVRFGVQFVSPTGELKDLDESLEADSAVGFSSGYEHVFIDRIGIDFNVAYSTHDLEFSEPGLTQDVGEINMVVPVTAGVNFHIVRNNIVDFYLGPFAGYVFYGDIDPRESDLTAISIEDDFAYGGTLGLDLSFTGKGLIFTSALKYMKTKAEPDPPGYNEIDVDPWVIQLGLGYRF